MSTEQLYDEINISQQPALEVLQRLGYTHIPTEKAEQMRGNLYNVLLRDVLENQLRKINRYEYKNEYYTFSENNIQQAIRDLDEPLTNGLVKANEAIYETVMLGRSYTEFLPDGSKKSFTIQFIDWDNIENNVFHVVEEFSVERADGKLARPDIVLFVNGIPFAVIECKKASISMNQGISQMIRNQKNDYIPQLFKFVQIVMATNKNETQYATCGTPKKFWSIWKEEEQVWLEQLLQHAVTDRLPTTQDKNIISLFHPARLLELTAFFTLFDKDVKKVTRYQQYFAIKKILQTVEQRDANGNRQSGVIWHTQGSGKSLTMVMLARYILTELSDVNPKVVVVTDRVELDKQIHKTFNHTRLKASRANSGNHLIALLNDGNTDIVTTLVHKFDTASAKQQLNDSRDIFVLIDESHRTQYGELHNKMKKVFPNASYLGFTGTPLMKKEKSTIIKFGKLIHKYTIADAVNDKAIVPLLYEGKMVDQTVNKLAIDNRLNMITRHLNDNQKEEVMKKWAHFERIASSDQRISMIAFDINEHFNRNYKTQGSQFKAMLATNSKMEAIRYLNFFEEFGDLNCAVVISPPDQREGHDDIDEDSQDLIQRFWKKMMDRYGTADAYEDAIKDEFINGNDEIDLLIVVDKLLTGFDAPRASILYIDKPMKEHTLLQAIARVNRLYEGKDYGLIIDYRGLLEKLDEALQMYSGAGLENFDPEDIQGAIYDVITIIGELRQYHSQLWDIFAPIRNKSDVEEYEVLLEDEELRNDFYDVLSKFARNLAIALESERIYNALQEEELTKYKQDLKFSQELRKAVKLRYSDSIDHKEYEAKMQKLMDQYISAEDIIRITNPVDILNEQAFEEEIERLGSKRAKADAIRTRLTKSVSTKWDENPAYYKKFSERIQQVIDEYKEKRISEADYLNSMNELLKEFRQGEPKEDYPTVIKDNGHAQAFYGVTKDLLTMKDHKVSYGDEDFANLAIKMDAIIKQHQKVDWHNNPQIHNRIAQDIDDLLFDFSNENNVTLDFDTIDKVIEQVKTVAIKRY